MRVLVIGGGIVGLTIVREFINRGIDDICLIDKGSPGKEASFAAAGMLAPQAESDSDDVFFRLCCDAREFYTEFSEQLFDETGVDIELDKTGTIYTAYNEEDEVELAERFAWQSAAGLDVERLSAQATHRLEPFVSPDSISSLLFPNDWQIENRSLVKALSQYAIRKGVDLREFQRVRKLLFSGERVIGAETSDQEVIDADIVILATGAWTSDIKTERTETALPEIVPVRGQMVSYKTAKPLISHVVYSPRGYVVPRKDGRILAGATVENVGFENEITKDGQDSIRKNTLEIVPGLINLSPTEQWSGLRPRAKDGLPLMGLVPGSRNLFISCGHYRNGILLGPLCSVLLVDHVLQKTKSVYLQKFSPDRFKAASSAK